MDLLLLVEQLEQAVLVETQEDPSSMGKEDLDLGVYKFSSVVFVAVSYLPKALQQAFAAATGNFKPFSALKSIHI